MSARHLTLADGIVARLAGKLHFERPLHTGRAQALEQNRNALIANVSFITLGAAAIATAVFLIIDLVSPHDDAPATPAKSGATP